MALTKKQIKQLRAMANSLKPLFYVGKNDLTESAVNQADETIEKHELIKCAVQDGSGLTAKEAAAELAEQPNAYAQPQYTAAPYAAAPVGQSSKSKLAAGLLGIFLGGLGVHNFYLGNTGKAVAQLLLTLVGWILLGLGPIAAAIWGFVEGIIILCSKPGSPWHKDANGYELSD